MGPAEQKTLRESIWGTGGGGGEGKREKNIVCLAQLVTLVLYLLKCDGKCQKKTKQKKNMLRKVNKNPTFLRVCSFNPDIYIYRE